MALVAPALAAVLVLLIIACASAASGAEPATQYLSKARAAAADDNHRVSIQWYLKAIERSPEIRSSVGLELGNQYTWAESPDTAITWYELHLSVHPDDYRAHLGLARALSWSGRLSESLAYYRRILPDAGEHATDVRLGIATVLSWQDKLWPARREYESILEDHPGNVDAEIGRARVINWAGRHREARGLFADLHGQNPDNHEILGGLASAHNWTGRPDRAIRVLDIESKHRDLAKTETNVRRTRRPRASYIFSRDKDSDDIERNAHSAHASFSPAWLTRIGARYTYTTIEQPSLPEVTRNQVSLTLQQRFSDALSLTVSPGYEANEFDRDGLGTETFWQDEHNLFVFDAYATITPIDWLRADIGVSRASIDNPVPIYRGLDAVTTSAGVDWRLAPTVLSVTSASVADYSDDNRRLAVSERVEWKPAQRLPVPFSHRFTLTTGIAYFDFDKLLDHGYYNPDQYLSVFEVLAVEMEFAKRLRVEMSGRLAAERENSDDWFSVGSFSASASLRVGDIGRVVAGYYNSRSRLDTSTGYEADGFWAGLEF